MQLIKRRLRHDIASRFLSDTNKRFLYKYTKIVVVVAVAAGQKGKRAKLQIAINFVLKQQQQQQLATILKVEESRNTKSGSCKGKGNASQAEPSRAK